ncbi:hypothetical protein Emed_001840 [Eimeria media]
MGAPQNGALQEPSLASSLGEAESARPQAAAAAAAETTAAAPSTAATAAAAPATAAAAAAPGTAATAAATVAAATAAEGASEATSATAAAAAASASLGGASAAKELHEATDTLLGYVLCFLAAVAYAVHTTALKAQEMRDPDFDVGLVYGYFKHPSPAAAAAAAAAKVVIAVVKEHGRAVFLLNPVVASAAANVQIPLSLLADAVVLGRSFDWWYVVGMTAVLAAVVAVTIITTEPPQHKKDAKETVSLRLPLCVAAAAKGVRPRTNRGSEPRSS